MTPEQEDAHWALMGKPLMRHWLAYRAGQALSIRDTRRRVTFNEFMEVLRVHGSIATTYWRRGGIEIDGVFYPDDAEGL